jgi:hypothetical protein
VKTVATFSKPEEAHLFRTRLEAAGIPAYVQDEHLIQMDWLYSNAIGGVRVGDFGSHLLSVGESATEPTGNRRFPSEVFRSERRRVWRIVLKKSSRNAVDFGL